MNNIFQIFGSKSSTDYDVMIFVDKIPQIEEAKQLCEKWDKKLYFKFLDSGMKIKTLNCNLAVLKDGIVVQVHKGTKSEVNNSLFLTYDYHQQFYEQQVKKLVERDVDIKIMRSVRWILMYLTRTQHRFEIKKALRSNFIEKIKILERIDLSEIKDLNKDVDWKDYLKSISFQVSQSLSLIKGIELYTKEDLSESFPELEPMLMRTGENLTILEKYKTEFVKQCKLYLKKMKTFDEYIE